MVRGIRRALGVIALIASTLDKTSTGEGMRPFGALARRGDPALSPDLTAGLKNKKEEVKADYSNGDPFVHHISRQEKK